MQEWKGILRAPIEAWRHKKKESVEVFQSNLTYLQKNIDLTRNFYDLNK
jgi:hypothetical protein